MRCRKNNFSDIEITEREVIASISIISVLLLVGILISSKMSEYQLDKNEIYNKAVKIESKDLFQYGMDTNIGNAFVYGDLESVGYVSYPEIDGQYMSITKVKERYTMHTRLVTRTRTVNGKTQTYTTTETYWTWDEVDRWYDNVDKVKFLDIEFDYGQIYKPHEYYIDTQNESSMTRYVYYGSSLKYTGTLFVYLGNGTIDNQEFYNDMTIDKVMDKLNNNLWIILFWIVWIIIIGGCVYGFYSLDNDWLE